MMVSRFIRIYLEGAQSSGEPAGVAELVSKNTTNLLSLGGVEHFHLVQCKV